MRQGGLQTLPVAHAALHRRPRLIIQLISHSPERSRVGTSFPGNDDRITGGVVFNDSLPIVVELVVAARHRDTCAVPGIQVAHTRST